MIFQSYGNGVPYGLYRSYSVSSTVKRAELFTKVCTQHILFQGICAQICSLVLIVLKICCMFQGSFRHVSSCVFIAQRISKMANPACLLIPTFGFFSKRIPSLFYWWNISFCLLINFFFKLFFTWFKQTCRWRRRWWYRLKSLH